MRTSSRARWMVGVLCVCGLALGIRKGIFPMPDPNLSLRDLLDFVSKLLVPAVGWAVVELRRIGTKLGSIDLKMAEVHGQLEHQIDLNERRERDNERAHIAIAASADRANDIAHDLRNEMTALEARLHPNGRSAR